MDGAGAEVGIDQGRPGAHRRRGQRQVGGHRGPPGTGAGRRDHDRVDVGVEQLELQGGTELVIAVGEHALGLGHRGQPDGGQFVPPRHRNRGQDRQVGDGFDVVRGSERAVTGLGDHGQADADDGSGDDGDDQNPRQRRVGRTIRHLGRLRQLIGRGRSQLGLESQLGQVIGRCLGLGRGQIQIEPEFVFQQVVVLLEAVGLLGRGRSADLTPELLQRGPQLVLGAPKLGQPGLQARCRRLDAGQAPLLANLQVALGPDVRRFGRAFRTAGAGPELQDVGLGFGGDGYVRQVAEAAQHQRFNVGTQRQRQVVFQFALEERRVLRARIQGAGRRVFLKEDPGRRLVGQGLAVGEPHGERGQQHDRNQHPQPPLAGDGQHVDEAPLFGHGSLHQLAVPPPPLV